MKAQDKIQQLLTDCPRLRDSDNKLIATYWFEEIQNKGMNINEMTAMEFLHLFADSKLTNSETIHRCRRKVQEKNKELRVKAYSVRQVKMQKQWRKELGYETN